MGLRDIFELLPVGLAGVAIVTATMKYGKTDKQNRRERILLAISILAAVLLIIAQSSWYVASVILGKIEDTWFANDVWSVFNTIVMANIILYCLPEKS